METTTFHVPLGTSRRSRVESGFVLSTYKGCVILLMHLTKPFPLAMPPLAAWKAERSHATKCGNCAVLGRLPWTSCPTDRGGLEFSGSCCHFQIDGVLEGSGHVWGSLWLEMGRGMLEWAGQGVKMLLCRRVLLPGAACRREHAFLLLERGSGTLQPREALWHQVGQWGGQWQWADPESWRPCTPMPWPGLVGSRPTLVSGMSAVFDSVTASSSLVFRFPVTLIGLGVLWFIRNSERPLRGWAQASRQAFPGRGFLPRPAGAPTVPYRTSNSAWGSLTPSWGRLAPLHCSVWLQYFC